MAEGYNLLDWVELGVKYQNSWMGGLPLGDDQNGGSQHLHLLGALASTELRVMRL